MPSQHIAASDSYAVPPENGFPWDAYHVNSIDVFGNGTFLVSMRNTWGVYLVNTRTGKIEWTLGGKGSTFKVPEADPLRVAARCQADEPDDADGIRRPLLRHHRRRRLPERHRPLARRGAEARHRRPHGQPDAGSTRTASPSSRATWVTFRTLPNGDAIVGWGDVPFFSEFSHSGQLIFDAEMPTPDITYRALRPALGRACRSTRPPGPRGPRAARTTVYASWNGATRVTAWIGAGDRQRRDRLGQRDRRDDIGHCGARSSQPASGPASKPRSQSAAPAAGSRVEALDAAGHVIGTSKAFSTQG